MTNNNSFVCLFDQQQFAQYPIEFTAETLNILRTLLSYLLSILIEIGHDQKELHLNDNQQRLTQYLSVLIHFTRYTPEKLLFIEPDKLHALCSLILHQKVMEDHTSNNGNKLLLFILLQQLISEKAFVNSLLNQEQEFKQQLPMCLIVVDHEDQELILYNRLFLFVYYNILKQMCQCSWAYCRELASHKNMSWALKNVLLSVAFYSDACEQLLSICKLVCRRDDETTPFTEDDERIIQEFKRELIGMVCRVNEVRTSWSVTLDLMRYICDTQTSHEERLLILQRRGLPILTCLFSTVYSFYHDQTQTHQVQDDLIYLLITIGNLLDTADLQLKRQSTTFPTSTAATSTVTPVTTTTSSCLSLPNSIVNIRNIVGVQWKEKTDLVNKLLFLLNSYNNSEIRQRSVDLLKKIIVQLSIQDLTWVASQVKHVHEQAAAQSHSQLGPCTYLLIVLT